MAELVSVPNFMISGRPGIAMTWLGATIVGFVRRDSHW